MTRATRFRTIGLLPCMNSAFDSCQMVHHAWTSRSASSLNFRFQANLDSVSAKLSLSIADFIPKSSGRFRSTDNRKTRFDLRHALDCDFVAVTSRTLPQSARTTYSFEVLLACSLSGASNVLQSPFPALLQLVADLHRQHRQLDCDSKRLNQLAPTHTIRSQR